MSIIESPEKLKLGESLPPNDPHVSTHTEDDSCSSHESNDRMDN